MIEAALARLALGPMEGAPRDVFGLSLLDWAACLIAGRSEPVARVLRASAEGQGPCTAILGAPLPPRAAALVNGTVSHALDYDDTHFAHVGHPSVAVIPAALAIAEARGASGAGFRDAALAGMEASVRAGVWLGRRHYEAGFHQTGTAGAIGATLACARLMALDEARTVQALGIVSTMASGLKSQFGTMGKPLNAGLAAASGVEAAKLAEAGLASNPAGLSGPQGFAATHAGEGSAFHQGDWLMGDVSHKLHACCHGLHAMLEAIRGADGLPAEPERIAIRTNPRWLNVCNTAAPCTGLEAKFSYRLVAAMALRGWDTAALATYSDAACAAPELVSLRDRVRVEGDTGLTDTQVELEIDGRALSHDLSVAIPYPEREARVRGKARALLGDALAERIEQACRSDALSDLTDALKSAT